ncbi:MAG: hypothetical protein E6G00_09610 [Actinobacteria bacterium]|nr:MAG: hypothetical protein E6G00_09610 [Actinomycetota bacterium]
MSGRAIASLAAAAFFTVALLAVPAGAAAFIFQMSFGGPGAGNGQFISPTFVAADNAGHVYVADSFNDRVEKFSSSGAFLRQWGTTGSAAGQFNNPQGIAADRAGHVYVADRYNARIDEFSSTGSFIKAYGWGVVDGMSNFETCTTTCRSGVSGGGAGQLSTPAGLAIDTGGTLWVADQNNNRIDKFNAAGAFVLAAGWGVADNMPHAEVCTASCQPGISGSGAGQFKTPQGIAADRAGHVYVTDTGNDRVEKFGTGGLFLRQWGSSGFRPGKFSAPIGAAAASAAAVYIADSGNARVEKFSPSGALLSVIGRQGSGNGEFELPQGLATDAANSLYVVDNAADRVEKFGNPSNAFSFGKLKRDEHTGTAQLTVNLPGPGTVVLHGSGVVTQSAVQAAGLHAAAARSLTLLVKPKGKAKEKLKRKGRVKIKVSVTFTPTGGVPNTRSKKFKLIER